MDRPLSVLLIEDDPLDCQEMIRHIESVKDIQLIGVTNNTDKALEYVKDFLPDAIILDLELHKGYGNGLMFLDSLRNMRRTLPIYVLVTTNNVSGVTHNGARKMGADFIMVKTQEDYSPKSVIDFLCSLKSESQLSVEDLSTLLADLIENAIIATSSSLTKNILVTMCVIDRCLQIDVQDSGIPFEAETLAVLGSKRVTTHKEQGGSGIGYLTIFEIIKKCGASLTITEYHSGNDAFSKSIKICFDGKSEFYINSQTNF